MRLAALACVPVIIGLMTTTVAGGQRGQGAARFVPFTPPAFVR